MIKIEKVDILPSKAGNGLKVRDFEIGCAKIVEISNPETKDGEIATFEDILEENHLSVGYDLTIGENGKENVFFRSDLITANNYVLVKIEKSGVSIITTPKEFCNIFGLSEDDAVMLGQYISALAEDRQLEMDYLKSDEGDIMFFRNKVDVGITKSYLDGELDVATGAVKAIMRSADYRTEYISDSFIKMFLISLIKACQDRYNKVNRDDTLRQIAAYLEGITYWDDGQLYHSSILDIENYINDIKGIIRIG